ncbi:MAG: ABC transporter permease [Candidatus Acidiferrales bacterium]
MKTLIQDLKYGLRMLRKSPGFAAIAILTLALGIGANTTIFSWINATLLNPVPGLASPNEVVALSLGKSAENPFPFTYPDYVAMRDGQQSFSGITVFNSTPMSLTGKGKPERVWGVVATANYFDVLGVRPIMGRTFLPAEDEKPNGAPVVVISYRMWQTHFGGDPNIVGRSIDINQNPYTIVGVTPAVFQGSQTGLRSDLWVPMMMESQIVPQGDLLHDYHYFWLFALARLKPGVTASQAQQEMTVRIQAVAKDHPQEHKGHDTVSIYPLWRAPFSANGFFSLILPMLMAIAGLVLLLACANVANLMLVRSSARRREIAIRMSLGASRWRLVRQLLVESLVLALAGGAVAMIITFWTAGSMMSFIPKTDFPIALNMRADRAVLFATLIISLLTGVIFGILPALRASGEAPVAVLKEDSGSASGGRGKARLASGLVVAQISLSLLLLICAGLFIRSFLSAQQINPGFNAHGVLLTSFDLFQAGYSPADGVEFDRQLVSKLEALPGVQSAALTSRVPLAFGGGSTSVTPEGYVEHPNESMEVQVGIVTPNYLKTIQNPLVSGRDFAPQDAKTAQRVAIVNEHFVDRYWPHQDAIGKQVRSDLTNEWFTVVGVARNSKVNTLNESPTPFIYLPLYQVYRASTMVTVRVAGDPLGYATSVEKTIHGMNADVVLYDVTTLETREEIASFVQRLAGTFVGAFGVLALVLAAVGIYGVTSYTTRQRTHEIGIRMALGAGRTDILKMVLGHGLLLTLIGVGIGLAAAFGLTRLLSSQLLGVTSTDALTFSSVAFLLCAVALVACYIPARRAMRVDPLVALRYE